MEENLNTKVTEAEVKSVDRYAGASVDIADDETVDTALVKERTKTLNDNPRNTDL